MAILSSCECRGPFGGSKVECSNGGTCNDGTCDCLKGFFGTNCTEVDSCEMFDVFCERGDCDNGQCFCDEGYEGDSCNIETRAQFIGYYAVTEFCDLDTVGGHNIWIERDVSSGSNIFIYNLFNYNNFERNGFFSKVEGEVNEASTTFKIPNQKPDGSNKTINGEGSITVFDSTNIQINIIYTTQNGSKPINNCELKGVRIANP